MTKRRCRKLADYYSTARNPASADTSVSSLYRAGTYCTLELEANHSARTFDFPISAEPTTAPISACILHAETSTSETLASKPKHAAFLAQRYWSLTTKQHSFSEFSWIGPEFHNPVLPNRDTKPFLPSDTILDNQTYIHSFSEVLCVGQKTFHNQPRSSAASHLREGDGAGSHVGVLAAQPFQDVRVAARGRPVERVPAAALAPVLVEPSAYLGAIERQRHGLFSLWWWGRRCKSNI